MVYITTESVTQLQSVSVCAGTVIKRTVHNNFSGLFFGLPFTKENPEFVQSLKSQFSSESKLLLVCQEGLRLVVQILLVVRPDNV